MAKLPDKDCTGCEACASVCPEGAITPRPDHEGFLRPVIDEGICTECGLCVERCPVLDEKRGSTDVENPKVYAAWHNDPKIRGASTSGGAFSAFALEILGRGGVVFGAAFDEEFRVCHREVTDEDGLASLRGSKYIQSHVGNTFKQAKHRLEQGKDVLFSGTSCQIAGLQAYLGTQYERLFTVDLICHGTPSPELWRLYLDAMERKYRSKVVGVSLRDKRIRWQTPTMVISFANGSEWAAPLTDSPFQVGFWNGLTLRPSCYACRFKRLPYPADITLGDFWAVELIHPKLERDAGISLVFVNSEKGKKLFEAVSGSLFTKESDLEFVKDHSHLLHSASVPPGREDFFAGLREMPFEEFARRKLKTRGALLRLAAKVRRSLLCCMKSLR
ncbi:MAG: Coenzyme F420 hydrogenase/dehydrogenase, beta subunit C-terminal domain [Pirellulales bacterium]|nr:Coenzyme F420 hydrogenase/dehydrogenase, beta subunit C-terminal domain [Pirellulales bacterium]